MRATIQIYDFGHTTDGIFYYAMEFLEGLSLRDLVLREGPIPQGRILFILQQIGGSLKEAHDAGLVHRDVKPANVFLTNRGGRADWVKVLDFGLVARFDDEENLNERGISTASIAGTPGYMAPEALAIPARVDVRSDIYSVGALGYFLLTGRGLFEGMTFSQIRDSYQQMDQAGLVFPFEPLPEGNLEQIIQQCLEKDPDRRPQNMTQLMELLAACPEADTWTIRESESWWRQYAESIPAPQKAAKCLEVQALEKTVINPNVFVCGSRWLSRFTHLEIRLQPSVLRQLAGMPGNRHRHAAARIHVAEQRLGHRLAALLTRKPGFHDRGCVLRDPTRGQRTAVDQHDHRGRAGGLHGLHQLFLKPG